MRGTTLMYTTANTMLKRLLKNSAARLLPLAAVVLLSAYSVPAHVKWFVEFDVTKPPTPIGEVLNGTFVTMFMISAGLVYLFFLVDRFLWKSEFLLDFDKKLKRFDDLSILIMRVCSFIFFFALFLWYMVYGSSFYITPELKTAAVWVPWVHLLIALCALTRWTAPVTGAGIFVLYIVSAFEYGLFHVLDYFIFLGIGYFLIASAIPGKGWLKSALIVLFACTGLTLVWASIEKFGYARWTTPLLEENPHMMMGMSQTMFMLVTGFVEFFVTFTLLGAASVVGRLISLALMSVFVLAVWEFGLVDAIGHLMIVAILFVLIVRGPTDAREMLVLRDKNIWTEAYFMTGLYYLALVTVFIAYYGLHWLTYGPYPAN